MTTQLDEFSINLPMVGVQGVGAVPTEYATYDMTSDTTLPPEISPSCSHIYVSIDSSSMATLDSNGASSPMCLVDLVLNVLITDPTTGNIRNYKLVKRISMDKLKLAMQVEHETPCQVIEAKTPEQQAQALAEAQAINRAFKAANRARELAGLPVLAESKE